MAFYHTYRPQNFKDIFQTQHDVAQSLVMSLVQDKIQHAYLFTGTHGTGKTSTARILAKAVNCEKFAEVKKVDLKKNSSIDQIIEKFPVPCNECDSCKSITKGSSLDVVELDAASNRGIDDIRELKENIRLMPISSRKKVFIIDEVHMLTTEAFNALLKTLEEPPAHAMFVLCTTELDKVPSTIQSRCSKLVLKRPSLEQIAGYIEMIVESEKLEVDEKAIQSIARASGGAYRDSAKLLEQLASMQTKITSELVEQHVIGSVAGSSMRIMSLLASRKYQDALSFIGQLESNGLNFNEIIKELIYHSRMVMYAHVNAQSSTAEYIQFAKYFDQFTLADFIEHLLKAYSQQRSTPLPSLPLELVILRIMRVAPTSTASVVEVKKDVVQTKAKTAEPEITKDKKTAIETSSPKPELELVDIVIEQTLVSEPSADTPQEQPQDLNLIQLQERWTEVVRLVKKYNASMSAIMSKCKPVKLDGKIVILETTYSFHKDIVESAKNRPIIEQAVFELLGTQVRIKAQLSNTKLVAKQVENVTEVQNEDLVAAVQEMFGA
jgi:DNA polymerase-3 subunit gamma/tau